MKLDYRGPERREPTWAGWFWSGLWGEVRSELAEIPLWLLVPFGGLLAAVVGGFVYIAWGVFFGFGF